MIFANDSNLKTVNYGHFQASVSVSNFMDLKLGLLLWSTKIIIFHIFTFFIIADFITDRYQNNFQEHLFRILKLRKY